MKSNDEIKSKDEIYDRSKLKNSRCSSVHFNAADRLRNINETGNLFK